MKSTRRLPAGGGVRQRAARRRRGVVYLFVLGTAMIVSLMAISSLTSLRSQRRIVTNRSDAGQARLLAKAAVEIGLAQIADDAAWRTTNNHGVWESNVALAGGSFDLEVLDPLDGNLADDESEAIVLLGTGRYGAATQMVQVTLVPKEEPLDLLASALHAGGKLEVKSGKTLTVSGAPASSNDELKLDGNVQGNVQGVTRTGGGSVSGQSTVPAAVKATPSPSIFTRYQGMATTLAFAGDITKKVIAPGYNDYSGGLNAQGVYYISTVGNDLKISNSRIYGTLVINASNKKVVIDGYTLMQNYQSNYPVLIVNGDLEVDFTGAAAVGLSESAQGRNYNPAGAPYSGATDSDSTDTYPSEIVGLVHVTGHITIKNKPARFRGVVFAEGKIDVDYDTQVIHLSDLATSAPWGYVYYPTLNVSQGSWQRSVE